MLKVPVEILYVAQLILHVNDHFLADSLMI